MIPVVLLYVGAGWNTNDLQPVKRPNLGGPGNPVHDTVKTVQGALRNTAKTWAPKKPKVTTTPKKVSNDNG